MKIRSKVIAAVTDWLAANYAGPIAVSREVADVELAPPYSVVRISTAEPLAAGEPVWNLMVIVGAAIDADTTSPVEGEDLANELFAVMTELDEDDFVEFCAARGVAISAIYPEDSSLGVEETRWAHYLGMRVIAAEI